MSSMRYYSIFYDHPSILKRRSLLAYHDQVLVDYLHEIVETFNEQFIVRSHPGGTICFGVKGDSEHFHSKSITRAVLQAIVWLETGDRWNARDVKWETDAEYRGRKP